MDVQDRLRRLLRAGFTEKAIASLIKVNQSTISRILSGKIRDPRGSLVFAINTLFDKEINKTKKLCVNA